jgi:glycosyltransferase involved in cell wall biosynthesis
MVAAIYSPAYSGAGYMAQLLKESIFAEQFELIHINTKFVESISALQKVSLIKALLFMKYLWLIFIALLTRKPDFVIICPAFSRGAFLKDSIYTIVCSHIFRRKVIWWAHALGLRSLYEKSDQVTRCYIQWVVGSVYQVVTVGYKPRQDFDFVCLPERIKTIHNGLPPMMFDGPSVQRERDIVVMFFSNLEITKGWKVLFEAAEEICARRENVIFDFYGNPAGDSSKEMIEQTFQSSAFTERIRYRGPAYRAAKNQAYADADIFCFPTYFPVETFGLVNLEAMNAGLPIVTTDHAAIPEVVIADHGGFLVPKKDPVALSEAILRLADDAELRRQMGEYNRERFYTHFTLSRFVNNWVELIHSLAAVAPQSKLNPEMN